MPSSVVTLSSAKDLAALIQSKRFVVLNFFESWHAPCVEVNKQLDGGIASQTRFADVQFVNIEVSEHEDVTEKYPVESVPTFVVLDQGTIVAVHEGADLNALITVLTNAQSKPLSAKTPEVDAKTALTNRLSALVKAAPVMLFMKGEPAAPQCGFSRQAVALLAAQNVTYSHFDILSDNDVRQGLKTFSNWPTFPQLYGNGELIGGLDTMKEMIEEGEFVDALPAVAFTGQGGPGGDVAAQELEALNARIKGLIEAKPIMLFMKGVPAQPQCGFSRTAIEVLTKEGVDVTGTDGKFGSFNILEDQEVRAQIKIYSDWPTFPQLYVNGALVGGLNIMKEMQEEDELKDALIVA